MNKEIELYKLNRILNTFNRLQRERNFVWCFMNVKIKVKNIVFNQCVKMDGSTLIKISAKIIFVAIGENGQANGVKQHSCLR